MRRLTTGMRSEKRVVRRFRRCAEVTECTYTYLDILAYCKPRLYGIDYFSQARKLYSIHTSLIDKIRLQVDRLEQTAWTIRFTWVRAHVGIRGNELADTLAKEAAADQDIPVCYDKIPKSVVKSELESISVEKWQKNWRQTTKGTITKAFFPRVEERLSRKLYTNQALTTILTGHGNFKAYLYHFKIIDSPTCPVARATNTLTI